MYSVRYVHDFHQSMDKHQPGGCWQKVYLDSFVVLNRSHARIKLSCMVSHICMVTHFEAALDME